MPLIVNPRNASYLGLTPYLTVAEYQNAPTAVDTSQLIPNGTVGQNTQALTDVIARASSMADTLCFQVLAPTLEIENRRCRIRKDATIAVKTKYWPILEVDTLSSGPRPDMLVPLTSADAALMWIEDPLVYAPAWSSGTTTSPSFTIPPMTYLGDTVYVQLSYLTGWPNTLVATGGVTAGSTTVTVNSALGIYGAPTNTVLTFYDGVNTETVTVTAVAGNVLTLSTGLLFAHAAKVSLSALPPAVKEAVICLTSFTIKTRGAEAVVMASIAGPPRHTAPMEGGGEMELGMAAELLAPYRRVA